MGNAASPVAPSHTPHPASLFRPMLTLVDHPLLKRAMTRLRDRDTPYGDFRRTLSDVSAMLAYEALRTLADHPEPHEDLLLTPDVQNGLGLAMDAPSSRLARRLLDRADVAGSTQGPEAP